MKSDIMTAKVERMIRVVGEFKELQPMRELLDYMDWKDYTFKQGDGYGDWVLEVKLPWWK